MNFFGSISARFNIGTRIGGGFAIVLALLVALAALGHFSLTGTRLTFENYAFVSDTTLRMAEAERDIANVQRQLREFIRTGSKASLDGLRQRRCRAGRTHAGAAECLAVSADQ
jgi:CHASE3 domain sensor protein